MTISHSEDKSRDIDEKVAKILGWTNLDWHFDRVEPMHMWLGGTPPGINAEIGSIEEVPEYSSDVNALVTLLDWLAAHYDVIELYSDCGYWFCRIKDIVTLKIIADPMCGYLTPAEAVCAVTLQIAENERT